MSHELHVYFIRHGQSTDNISGVFQGPDSALTELGQRQARYVAERAKTLPIQVILTSPFRRAHETARHIADATGLPLEVHETLREYLAPSALLGTPMDTPEGVAYLAALRAHYGEKDWHYADEDSYHDLHAQARTVLDMVIARSEQHIAVVSHAGFMRVLVATMIAEGEPDPVLTRRLARFLAPVNTGITVCRYRPNEERRNKWRMLCWNDHAHLGETDKEEPTESPV